VRKLAIIQVANLRSCQVLFCSYCLLNVIQVANLRSCQA
jgi:hypothetical protein